MVDNASLKRLRNAVDLVLRDAQLAYGSDSLAVIYADDDIPEELGHLTDPTSLAASWGVFSMADAILYVRGESSCVGLACIPHLNDEELTVHVADSLQEVAVESDRYFGRAFPPCPEHPHGAPLWPKVIDGRAVWACLDGGTFRVAIGSWVPS